jgi:hypothetical protein
VLRVDYDERNGTSIVREEDVNAPTRELAEAAAAD